MTSGKELATLSIVKINGYSLELFSELDETLRNICKLKRKKNYFICGTKRGILYHSKNPILSFFDGEIELAHYSRNFPRREWFNIYANFYESDNRLIGIAFEFISSYYGQGEIVINDFNKLCDKYYGHLGSKKFPFHDKEWKLFEEQMTKGFSTECVERRVYDSIILTEICSGQKTIGRIFWFHKDFDPSLIACLPLNGFRKHIKKKLRKISNYFK